MGHQHLWGNPAACWDMGLSPGSITFSQDCTVSNILLVTMVSFIIYDKMYGFFIDRHILTSNINQCTKCCLLSTKLFKVRVHSLICCIVIYNMCKFFLLMYCNFFYSFGGFWTLSVRLTRLYGLQCLLMASMPHPMMDLAYSTYSVETELIPGIDLFSEPDRGNLGTTIASLSFLCHWLYNSGHFLKVKDPQSERVYFVIMTGWLCLLYSI